MDLFDLRKWKGFVSAGGDPRIPALIDHVSIDSRHIYSSQTLFVPLKGKHVDGHAYIPDAIGKKCRYVLASKDYTGSVKKENVVLLRVDSPLRAFQEIAATYRGQFQLPVIAITGSYGKTLLKDLLGSILKTSKKVISSPESFNSQIGVPLSLFHITKEAEVAIIEAGVSLIGEMDFLKKMISPKHVILTKIGAKHALSLNTAEIRAQEMGKLLEDLPNGGWGILSSECQTYPFAKELKQPVYWNLHIPSFPFAKRMESDKNFYIIEFPDGEIFQTRLPTGQSYFLDLANIALKASWLMGSKKTEIKTTLNSYLLEPMRTEIWESTTGLSIINEPYCGDLHSIDKALRRLKENSGQGKKFFIFGGIRTLQQNGQHNPFKESLENIDELITVGDSKASNFADYASAIAHVKTQAKIGDAILIKGPHKVPLDEMAQILDGSIHTNQCFINLTAIETNLKIIKHRLSSKTRIMPIIKAAAYGTHPFKMAHFLESQGIDIVGVSYVDEGIALKKASFSKNIFTINAAVYEASKAVQWDLEIGVSDLALIQALAKEAQKQNKTVKVHLHVDTGMSRFGCRKEEALFLSKEISRLKNLKLEGIMTHFSRADDPAEDSFTKKQASDFDKVITEIESQGNIIPWKHAANSAATMRFHFPQYNMTRIGLALYGLGPSKTTFELKPAFSLQSKIVGINYCKKGETIGYGRNYHVTREEQRIAIIPIGYFDGLHRHYSGKGFVLIQGIQAPMIGNICMDYTMVDISDNPEATLGSPVLIFGEDEYGNYLPPEDFATQGGSIAHELITCLGPRIQRVFVYEETPRSC